MFTHERVAAEIAGGTPASAAPFTDHLKLALILAWLVISTALVPVLLAPLLLPPDTIFELVPICEARARNKVCIFCGMTTSFVMIGHGELNQAVEAHKAGVPLYAALVWNECVAAWFVAGRLARARARRRFRIVLKTVMRTEES